MPERDDFVIDQEFTYPGGDRGGQTYTLTQIRRLPALAEGVVIRVTVHYNRYPQQADAVAEVLNGDRKWTRLLTAPVDTWHGAAPNSYRSAGHKDRAHAEHPFLVGLLDQLADRAERVLAVAVGIGID